jgi:hypothetical protein
MRLVPVHSGYGPEGARRALGVPYNRKGGKRLWQGVELNDGLMIQRGGWGTGTAVLDSLDKNGGVLWAGSQFCPSRQTVSVVVMSLSFEPYGIFYKTAGT